MSCRSAMDVGSASGRGGGGAEGWRGTRGCMRRAKASASSKGSASGANCSVAVAVRSWRGEGWGVRIRDGALLTRSWRAGSLDGSRDWSRDCGLDEDSDSLCAHSRDMMVHGEHLRFASSVCVSRASGARVAWWWCSSARSPLDLRGATCPLS